MSSSDSKTGNTLTLELLENILKTDNGGIQPSTNSSALDGLAFGEQVYEAIRAGISADDKTTLSQIKNLKREIVVRSICEDRTTDPFLQIAAVLHDACLKPGVRAGATDWDNVIRIVLSNKDRLSVYQQPTDRYLLLHRDNVATVGEMECRDGCLKPTSERRT